MHWSNHKIQILLKVVSLLIRLKVVKDWFAGPLEVGRSPPSKSSSLGIFLSIEYCSAYFRFGSFLLRRFFRLPQYRLRLYFGSSSTGLSVFISCSSTLAHVFPHCYFDYDRLHFQFNLIERILNTVIE